MYVYEAFLSALLVQSASAAVIKRDPTLSKAKLVPDDSSATVNPPAAVGSINNDDGIGAGSNTYTFYQGDGTPSSGWPSQSQWVSFVDM